MKMTLKEYNKIIKTLANEGYSKKDFYSYIAKVGGVVLHPSQVERDFERTGNLSQQSSAMFRLAKNNMLDSLCCNKKEPLLYKIIAL